MHLADTFIQSRLTIQAIHLHFPWELNPQPFALLTQCSTTEPQETYTKLRTVPPIIIYNYLNRHVKYL